MKTRALIAAFALSAIVLGSGVSAFAYNGYHNYGNHAGMYAVSPEKQGAYDAMMKDYYSRVSPIQDKLNAKGIELDALSRNPNAKPETISKLANQVAELRSQLRAERMTLGDKMEKELGVQPGRGMMGNGMMGNGMMGNGMGYHNGGRHGGGHFPHHFLRARHAVRAGGIVELDLRLRAGRAQNDAAMLAERHEDHVLRRKAGRTLLAGRAHGLKAAVNKEQLIRFGLRIGYALAGYIALRSQHINKNVFHPSLTLTFRFGPPSETRTHSL